GLGRVASDLARAETRQRAAALPRDLGVGLALDVDGLVAHLERAAGVGVGLYGAAAGLDHRAVERHRDDASVDAELSARGVRQRAREAVDADAADADALDAQLVQL